MLSLRIIMILVVPYEHNDCTEALISKLEVLQFHNHLEKLD